MDFLKKIDYLLKKNNLNKNTLSKNCNIPYTTIDGWYKKGYEGIKLTTLNKLTQYFKVTLDYLVDEKVPLEPILYENSKIQKLSIQELSQEKKELLNNYDKLNEDGKEEANKRVEELTQIPKYQINYENKEINNIKKLPISEEEQVKIIARGKGITTISREELERIKSTGIEVDNINDYF